jgi:hypothetical protein
MRHRNYEYVTANCMQEMGLTFPKKKNHIKFFIICKKTIPVNQHMYKKNV